MPAAPDATAERIKDANTRYHDVAAKSYDAKWGINFGETGRGQVTEKLRKALGGAERRHGDALEIGSGTGYFSLNLLSAGAIETATCTDISPGMLATLRGNAGRLGFEVETVVAEAERLPFADDSFDLVFGHAVLHHIPDLRRATGEFLRVLRPGGTVAFCGEPSANGDRVAAVPKRLGAVAAPVWRALVRAPKAHGTVAADAEEAAGHELESEVDVHAFDPETLARTWSEAYVPGTTMSSTRPPTPGGTSTRCSNAVVAGIVASTSPSPTSSPIAALGRTSWRVTPGRLSRRGGRKSPTPSSGRSNPS